MWFSYDPEDGIKFHDVEAEAKYRAERSLEAARDIAMDDGWETAVTEICWGEVCGHVCQSASVTLEQGGDAYVEYQLVDVPNTGSHRTSEPEANEGSVG